MLPTENDVQSMNSTTRHVGRQSQFTVENMLLYTVVLVHGNCKSDMDLRSATLEEPPIRAT